MEVSAPILCIMTSSYICFKFLLGQVSQTIQGSVLNAAATMSDQNCQNKIHK